MRYDVTYTPSGKAGEFADKGVATNPFKGCEHGCIGCYVPEITPGDHSRSAFHGSMVVKDNYLERLEKDLQKLQRTYPRGELIFLSFTTDPWPYSRPDLQAVTLRAIGLIHRYGYHVNILSKGATRDLVPHLVPGDRLGATLTCSTLEHSLIWEPGAAYPVDRISGLHYAKASGIYTWVSEEPIYNADWSLDMLVTAARVPIDQVKFGRSNHLDSKRCPWNWHSPEAEAMVRSVDYRAFLHEATGICRKAGIAYYVKLETREFLPDGIPDEWHPAATQPRRGGRWIGDDHD